MSASKPDSIVKQKKRTEKEFTELGKAVSTLFETGAISKRALYKASFMRGVLSGFGGILGATVGIALFLWFLSLFNEIPILGELFESLKQTIESK